MSVPGENYWPPMGTFSCPPSLVNEALSMAARERKTSTETILHSDHGSGFISWSFSQNLRHHKLLGSVGMAGECLFTGYKDPRWFGRAHGYYRLMAA